MSSNRGLSVVQASTSISSSSLPSTPNHRLRNSLTASESDRLSVCSSDLNGDEFLSLSEDHFGDITEGVDCDENGLPIDKKDIIRAISKYIKLIRIQGNDQDRTAKLIIRLCELRIKLNKMNENEELNLFHGHQMQHGSKDSSSNGLICDVCLKRQKTIPLPESVLKNLNFNFVVSCDYCNFKAHRNCMSRDIKARHCPRELFEMEELDESDRYSRYVVLDICPEKGLTFQDFRCGDCQQPITLANSRLCDYDGLYYCFRCHWNDQSPTPARVVHNWDFSSYPVSRRSLQMIQYIKKRPVLFNILQLNTMLYGLVDELNLLKRLRLELSQMVQYIKLCRQPTKPKLNISSYLVEENQCDSLAFGDMINASNIHKTLGDVHVQLTTHITKDCEGCRGKGFFCELCNDKTDLLFPFSTNIANCPQCNTVFHKNCYYRKHKFCPKCDRIRRKQLLEQEDFEASGEHSTSHSEKEDSSSSNQAQSS